MINKGTLQTRCGSANGTSENAHKYHYTLHKDNYDDDVFSSWFVVGVYFLKKTQTTNNTHSHLHFFPKYNLCTFFLLTTWYLLKAGIMLERISLKEAVFYHLFSLLVALFFLA